MQKIGLTPLNHTEYLSPLTSKGFVNWENLYLFRSDDGVPQKKRVSWFDFL